MKKPKINLKAIHTGHQFIDVEGVSSLMTCNAYSEMIDALIDVYGFLNQIKITDTIHKDRRDQKLNKILMSLKKAGVEL